MAARSTDVALPQAPPAGSSFSAKQWVNAALRAGDDETTPLDMRLSVLITRLQIAASDVDSEIQQATVELTAVAPKLAREIVVLREQASTVRTELGSLMHEAAELSERSEDAVAVLRETLKTQQRLAGVSETLAQAESVSQQLRGAELAFERGEAADSAGHISELSRSLGALGERGAELFPTAAGRCEAAIALEHGDGRSRTQELQPAGCTAAGRCSGCTRDPRCSATS
eukprot:3318576-Prymnesium_polylepis.1